jgi:hypothetical protein
MKTKQVARQHRRLPGEIAFDRCFLPLVSLLLFKLAFEFLAGRSGASDSLAEEKLAAVPPTPMWHAWLWFVLGLVFGVLWFRASVTLARAWNDASSRVLRFPALVVLVAFAAVTSRLLLAPFQ